MKEHVMLLVVLIVFALIATLSGVGAHMVTANHYKAEIALLQKDHAERLAEQTRAAQEVERKQSDTKNQLEAGYVQTLELQMLAERETSRLALDLDLAVARLRDAGTAGAAAGLPSPAQNAGSCNELRTANARLANALERLVGGGGDIVADGARAENVAAIAAKAARAYGSAR